MLRCKAVYAGRRVITNYMIYTATLLTSEIYTYKDINALLKTFIKLSVLLKVLSGYLVSLYSQGLNIHLKPL